MKEEPLLDLARVERLIPCPCCGNRHPLMYKGEEESYIICDHCGLNSGFHPSIDIALNVWCNREDKVVQALEQQVAGLRYMIDNNLTWKDVLEPSGDDSGHVVH